MPRCGDCKHFLPQANSQAANDGFCKAQVDEEGLLAEVKLYGDASKCKLFEELDRIRTQHSEFMWDPYVRSARGFEEK